VYDCIRPWKIQRKGGARDDGMGEIKGEFQSVLMSLFIVLFYFTLFIPLLFPPPFFACCQFSSLVFCNFEYPRTTVSLVVTFRIDSSSSSFFFLFFLVLLLLHLSTLASTQLLL
jgi:hypothetical protein